MKVKFDPILNKLRQQDIIPEVTSDPSNPSSQDAWVLRTVGSASGGGSPIGMLLALTTPGTVVADTYQFSYRTIEGTTVRATLS